MLTPGALHRSLLFIYPKRELSFYTHFHRLLFSYFTTPPQWSLSKCPPIPVWRFQTPSPKKTIQLTNCPTLPLPFYRPPLHKTSSRPPLPCSGVATSPSFSFFCFPSLSPVSFVVFEAPKRFRTSLCSTSVPFSRSLPLDLTIIGHTLLSSRCHLWFTPHWYGS